MPPWDIDDGNYELAPPVLKRQRAIGDLGEALKTK